ncbi:MAG: hypothetical protein FWC61_03445 [Proteobacteria bacterium]|nr:hypothetical protein [Pseudomonadota bacterium]
MILKFRSALILLAVSTGYFVACAFIQQAEAAIASQDYVDRMIVPSDWDQTDTTANDYIKNKPTLGTAAAANIADFATAAQGAKADTALQAETDPSIDTTVMIGDAQPPVIYGATDIAGNSKVYTVQKNEAGKAVVSVPWTDTVLSVGPAGVIYYGGMRLAQAADIGEATLAADSTTAGQNYRVKLDGTGIAYVNVPWTDTVYTHPTSGVNPGAYGPTANATLTSGGTFTVPQVTVDANGHTTIAATRTLTMPTIPAQIQADWAQVTTTAADYIKNKPTLGTAAAANVGDFATAAQGAKADTAVQPGQLATVATSGSYNDLTNQPTIPAAQIQSDWAQVTTTAADYIKNKPTLGTAAAANVGDFATAAQGAKADTAVQPGQLATVATTGSYNDLTNQPTIPAAQIQSDWAQVTTTAADYIKNKPTLGTAAAADVGDFATAAQGAKADTAVQPGQLATVATSGSYNDLINTPTIPAAYTLPAATNAALGGVKLAQAADAAAATLAADSTTAGQNYRVKLDSGGIAYVNIPWTDTVYTHPTSGVTAGAYGPTANATVAFGGTFTVPQVTVDANGHTTVAATRTFTMPPAPPAQIQSDWNAASGVAQILNKPTLGTAAAANIADFATAAQGALANTAVQPGQLAPVATTGSYNSLTNKPIIPAAQIQSDWAQATTTATDYIKNKPTLGTAAAANVGDFATAAQGALANTAVQPGQLATVATTGSYNDLTNQPKIPAEYTLPAATNAALGGVKLAQAADAAAATLAADSTTAGQNYRVKLDSGGIAYVNIPWTDTVYTHPTSGVTAGAYGPTANAALASGGTFAVPQVTVDANGHTTVAATRTLTMPGTATNAAPGFVTLGAAKDAAVTTTPAPAATGTYYPVTTDNTDKLIVKVPFPTSVDTLTTARTIQTDLASAVAASFNGSANVTPGVTGVLGFANGGTNAASQAAAFQNIVGYSGTFPAANVTWTIPSANSVTVTGVLNVPSPTLP